MPRYAMIVTLFGGVLVISAQAQWVPVASFPDATARTNAAGLNDGGRLYAIGGTPFVPGGNQTPAHYMDPNAPIWKVGTPAEAAIIRQGVGVDNLGRIVVFGGVNGIDPGEDPGQTYQYDIVEGQWTGLADRSGAAPDDYFAFATDAQRRIYSLGGGPGPDASAGNPNTNHVERYIGSSDSWETVASMPVAVADAAAVNDGRGHIIVFGGYDATAATRVATVQQYDVAGNTWTLLPDMPAALTGHCAVTGVDERVHVFGGVAGAVGAGVTQAAEYVLHLDTLTWSTGQTMSTPRSHFAAALWDDEFIYAMGGENDSGGTNTVEKLFTPRCPVITSQPAAIASWVNTAASFSVSVSGAAPFNYQWRKDGIDLSDGPTGSGSEIGGSNDATLVISAPRSADAGSYDVVVTNACGETISAAADLTVRIPIAIPANWEVVSIQPPAATLGSGARGISNGFIGGYGNRPTVLPDGRTFNLDHPYVWDTANLVPLDITPSTSVGGGIYDVEGDLLVGWFWHTWSCPSGGQTWTCAWQSAAFWTAPNFSFQEAVHSSGAEFDSLYGTDGTSMVGTLTYEYTEGNYDSKAHLWTSPSSGFSLHFLEASDTGANAVDGAYQYGSAYQQFGSAHATRWNSSSGSHVDLHPAGYSSSYIQGAGDDQAVGTAGSHAGLWIGAGAFIDLHPAVAASSSALATHEGIQSGSVAITGLGTRAALWSGTPESYVDLGAVVPPGFTVSVAEDFEVQPDGSVIVVGYGYNANTTRYEAIVWRSTPGADIDGDIDGDGDVDLTDLAILLSQFDLCNGDPGFNPAADVNANGCVDLADLAILLSNFNG